MNIDIRRQKLHEDIDKLQHNLSMLDGTADAFMRMTGNEDMDLLITDALTRRVDECQINIETNQKYDHRIKVKYLSGLFVMLDGLYDGLSLGSLTSGMAPVMFDAYQKLMHANDEGVNLLSVAVQYPHSINNILLGSKTVFFDSQSLLDARVFMYKQYAGMYPEKALSALVPFLGLPFADSVIVSFADRFTSKFYDYAAANATNIGKKIRMVKNPKVELMVKLADDRSGRLLFPFFQSILQKRVSYDSIKNLIDDDLAYYKMLVSTQVDYLDDMLRKDTPVLYQEINKMLERKAASIFINEMNALHEENDETRFKVIEKLSPRELYHIIVSGEDIIYTSSYVGVFNRMMSRLDKQSGSDLLMQVRFDKFRKFIKMAAGYNKLDYFLHTMSDTSAQMLMKAFVRGLDKSFSLEDAVDVADSYGSISDSLVKRLVQDEIKLNLLKQNEIGNTRGATIYDILDLLFKSVNDSGNALMTKYKIPTPYIMPYNELADASGKVVQLVFFYGDKDGTESFNSFINPFVNKSEWKIVKNSQWVEIKSLIGKPILIFANLPLEGGEGDELDIKAQEALAKHMDSLGLQPTIVIHRGHSYHLKSTLAQLPSSSKIVVLGSCGSYQNLNTVLMKCPDAQIVSSKEVGTKMVNEPILKLINETLRKGEKLDWINMWIQLQKQLGTGITKERFENYIPPHKNLGALFIKAYQHFQDTTIEKKQ